MDNFYVRLRHNGHFIWCNFKATIEDAVREVKKQLGINEDTDIIIKDKDGATIQHDFLIEFLKINERGVVLRIETDKIDEIALDISIPSTETIETASDKENSDQNEDPIYVEVVNSNLVDDFPKFDLETLLKVSPLGNSITNFYSVNSYLDNSKRNRLVDIICKHIYNYIVKHRLKHSEYNILTAKIISLFPNECPETYYVPAVKKAESATKKHILAKGKLVDKIKNLLFLGGVTRIKTPDEKPLNNVCDISEDAQNAALWLKSRTEPWHEVCSKWQISYPLRKQDTSSTIEKYLKNWPILLDNRAESLINLDFDELYPESGLNLINQWHVFFEKLYSLVNKNDVCKELYVSLQESSNDNSKVALELYMLPHLIPCKGRKRLNNGHWKFSIQESLESIIVHAKTVADIEILIEDAKRKAVARNYTIQPYIVIEGPHLETINNIYIVIDTIKYKFHQLLFALDICFKIFHTLNASYPPQSQHIWTIIQKCIYKVSTKQDKVFPYLMHIYKHFSDS